MTPFHSQHQGKCLRAKAPKLADAYRACQAVAIIGRYILTPDIFDEIENTKPGTSGEIQITDAMRGLLKKRPFYAVRFDGTRHDAGDKLSFLIATVEFALRRPVTLRRSLLNICVRLNYSYLPSLNHELFMTRLRNLTLIGSLFSSQIACGQTQVNQNASRHSTPSAYSKLSQQKGYPNLKMQAEQLAEAFDRKDYDKAASLTYPKQVELMGGREGMVGILNRVGKQAEAENMKLLSTTVGEPEEIIRIERQLFAIVPTTLKIKRPEGIFVGNGFLIGVSNDDGESWTFVDGSGGRNQEKLSSFFPGAAGKLKLPELKPLVLERKP